MAANAMKRKTKKPNGRLDAEAWISVALEALTERGIGGVRIEDLARRLGVTKGSFYWHFRNRDELYEAMLQRWRMRSTLALIDRIEQANSSATEKLAYLVHLMVGPRSKRGDQLELCIRLWGRHSARAAEVMREVDELRVKNIAALLRESGIPAKEVMARALIVYSYMRIAASLHTIADEPTMDLAEAILIDQSTHL